MRLPDQFVLRPRWYHAKKRVETVMLSRKHMVKKVIFHPEWRVFQNAGCDGMQTYVIALEKSDGMVSVPSLKDMKLLYIAHI